MGTDRSMEGEVVLTARKFAARHVAPVAAESDHSGPAFPEKIFSLGVEAGFDRLVLPEDADGSGLGMIELCALVRTLAETCAGHAMVFGVQAAVVRNLHAVVPGKKGGALLEALDARRPIAVVMPEPMGPKGFETGFSVSGKKGTDILISGENLAINAAPSAAVLLFAKDESDEALALLLDGKGALPESPELTLGLRAMPICMAHLVDFPAGPDRIVAKGGAAAALFRDLMRDLCLISAAAASGVMSAACEKAYAYAAERYQGGKMIIDHTHLRSILGGMTVRAKSSGGAVLNAAANPEDGLMAISTKAEVSRNAVAVCTDAVQILGGYGYMRDFGLEKMMRDAAVLSLVPASNDRIELLIAEMEKARRA